MSWLSGLKRMRIGDGMLGVGRRVDLDGSMALEGKVTCNDAMNDDL